jgi:hypothetical protein
LALKSVETTYGKILNKSEIGEIDLSICTYNDAVAIGYLEDNDGDDDDTKKAKNRKKGVIYKAFITELIDPNNGGLQKTNSDNSKKSLLNFNTRKIKFLDPQGDYDPTNDISIRTSAESYVSPTQWMDPWGNMYKIFIDKKFRGYVPVKTSKTSYKNRAGSFHIYSSGPDGIDSWGSNEDQGGADGTDDIATWHK